MPEISNEVLPDMQTAVGVKAENNPRNDFYYSRELPENLRVLETIAWNFYWSWSVEGAELFRELDPQLWQKHEQSPRAVLKEVSELRLWQKAADENYVGKVSRFAERVENYLNKPARKFGNVTEENPVAYFCAEYGVHNSLPIYSGGLGILAGDHLKSASDLNVPLVAVGLFYRYGYFRQQITHNGWQDERYQDLLESELALTPVVGENGGRVVVSVSIRGREVFAQAWRAQVGRIALYLLDTNIAENSEIDRYITGHLYGGDTETRVVQEQILGIGGVRLLRKLGVEPSVFHLNEGHSAFLTLELAREFLEANANSTFEEAANHVREKCVFTTHTPVAAGNDNFSPEMIEACVYPGFVEALKISREELFKLGRTNPADEQEWFGMTPLAMRMTRSANGVSLKHGEVSRNLWLKMFPEKSSAQEVSITHVTNGVHPPTWIAPVFQNLFEKSVGENWKALVRDESAWKSAVENIPDGEIWRAHLLLKNLLVAYIRQRTQIPNPGLRATIHEHKNTQRLFDPNALTIGFARRIAAYKRWNLLFFDMDRLLRMINDSEKPVQFVFAGKAHPQDLNAKQILQNLMSINGESNWQQRAVFIEDYDQEVARYLVRGVDVWMNVPRRPLEASGTSGQKAAMNGGLNLSILDGWWIEGYNGENGFAVGRSSDEEIADESGDNYEKEVDQQDAESLYEVLENQVIPAYYQKDETGLPREWIRRMKNSLATLTPQFSSDRMVKDYIEKIYTQNYE